MTAPQQRELYDWLVAHGENVLTGDSFFHLAAYGDALPGLNLCGAGRVVCLIDPVGDVYACPFAIHDNFLAGNVRAAGGFAGVWRDVRTVRVAALRRRPAARARRARRSTRAAAVAWRRSSSPACRWTDPTPSACKGTASSALRAADRAAAPKPVPRPLAPAPCRCTVRTPTGEGVRRESAGRCARSLADLATVEVPRGGGTVLAVPLGFDRAARCAPAALDRHRHRGRAVHGGSPPCGRCRRRTRRPVRVERRARGFRGNAVDRAGRDGAAAWSSSAARRRKRSRTCCSSRHTAATPHRSTRAVAQLRDEGRDVSLFQPPWDGDAHAGRVETSLQLLLRPGRSSCRSRRRRRHPSAGRVDADVADRRGRRGDGHGRARRPDRGVRCRSASTSSPTSSTI